MKRFVLASLLSIFVGSTISAALAETQPLYTSKQIKKFWRDQGFVARERPVTRVKISMTLAIGLAAFASGSIPAISEPTQVGPEQAIYLPPSSTGPYLPAPLIVSASYPR